MDKLVEQWKKDVEYRPDNPCIGCEAQIPCETCEARQYYEATIQGAQAQLKKVMDSPLTAVIDWESYDKITISGEPTVIPTKETK